MIVNTTDGKIKLTKRERDRLEQAGEIVAMLAKHGTGDVQEAALQAETALEGLGRALFADDTVEAA